MWMEKNLCGKENFVPGRNFNPVKIPAYVMKHKTTAIILAGGAGKRMKMPALKQFLNLAGKPIILRTLEHFDENPLIADIVIVFYEAGIKRLKKLLKKITVKKPYKIIQGGRTRQESSFIGLNNCPLGTKFVLIHDAVRPLIDKRIISDVIFAAKKTGSAGPVIETEDTIIIKRGKFIKEIPDRKILGRMQTPQGFSYKTIYAAHVQALKKGVRDATDDCGLVMAMDRQVRIVAGSKSNIKITTQADLFLAKKLYLADRF